MSIRTIRFIWAIALALCYQIVKGAPQNAASLGLFIAEFEKYYDTESFIAEAETIGMTLSKRLELKSSFFNGISFEVHGAPDGTNIREAILKLSKIKDTWPVQHHNLPEHEILWKGSEIPRSQTGSKRNLQEDYPSHVMTQVDRLKADGITGAGIKIAIIDTGVDYSHPLLGGCFGEGCKVGYGHDLVGDEYNGKNLPVPDSDPMDCAGHGTHIAGIIAAKENRFGFAGAAQDVTIGAYRVYGCSGRGVATDVLIAAFTQAAEDGSNIITASIGSPGGWPYDAWTLTVERIVDSGIPCIMSTGNGGQAGLFMPNSAAHGKNVASIGSYDNTQYPTFWLTASYAVDGKSEAPFDWTSGDSTTWTDISLPLFALSHNTSNPNDGCSKLLENIPDLSEYIVLIRRGECHFSQKAANAKAKGARYILFYSNNMSVYSPDLEADGLLGIGMISADQGAKFIDSLSKGSKVIVKITGPANATTYATFRENDLTGGSASTYTNWGPTFELDVKPQFGAPGGWILSTYPLSRGGFAVLSGTSMAGPLVAAIYALVAQVRGTFDPTTLKNVLSATARPSKFNNGRMTYSYLAPVPQQGGGMIQAYDAAHSTTVLSTASLLLNDTEHFVMASNFSITNSGHAQVSYRLSYIGAATAYALGPDSITPAHFPPELSEEQAHIEFIEDIVTVQAGESKLVQVSIRPPLVSAARIGVYSGYITIDAANEKQLSLPFMGVVGSMRDATVLAEAFVYNSPDENATPIVNGTRYELIGGGSGSTLRNDSAPATPAVSITLALGSPLLRIDVVPYPARSLSTKRILGVASLGGISGFPKRHLPRGDSSWSWSGRLDDGSYVPEGQYQLLIRALRIFGDVENSEDYDKLQTVVFKIVYRY